MPFSCIPLPGTGAARPARLRAPSLRQSLPLLHGRRALVVVAHPDDETIGAGAQLGRFEDVRILQVTDGAPRSGQDATAAGCASWRDYAALRRRELDAALGLAGISPDRLDRLGFADQDASFHLAAIVRQIVQRIEDWRPELVLTHAYEGGHPDHDATAFAAHAACAVLDGAAPELVEMAGYHAGQDGGTRFQEFLPHPGLPVLSLPLGPAQRALKRRMLDAHASQARTLAPFRDDVERFRRAPAYGFVCAPHAGPLNYERFAWGMTGERWRALAAEASRTLGPEDGMDRRLEGAGWL